MWHHCCGLEMATHQQLSPSWRVGEPTVHTSSEYTNRELTIAIIAGGISTTRRVGKPIIRCGHCWQSWALLPFKKLKR